MSQAILEAPANGGAVATLDDPITSCSREPAWDIVSALEIMADTLIGGDLGESVQGISLGKLGEAVLDVGPQGQWMLAYQIGRATCK